MKESSNPEVFLLDFDEHLIFSHALQSVFTVKLI